MPRKTYPLTTRLGREPNAQGVYICPPDLISTWLFGADHAHAKLLELDGGQWLTSQTPDPRCWTGGSPRLPFRRHPRWLRPRSACRLNDLPRIRWAMSVIVQELHFLTTQRWGRARTLARQDVEDVRALGGK